MGKDMERSELVFIPTPGIGHVTATIEVGRLITGLDPQFSVTILIMKLPDDKHPIPESPSPKIRLLELRRKENSTSTAHSGPHYMKLFQIIDDHKPNVKETLAGISSSGESRLAGIVVDMFCTSMIDVAKELGVPSYLFYTSSASILGHLLHLQSLRDDHGVDITELKDSDAEMVFPTYKNPVPARVFPSGLFDKVGGKILMDQGKMFRETKGIIINTFQELEPYAIQALWEDENVPPVFPIGPLLNLDATSQIKENYEIMSFLDQHPDSSVIFLCFGSMGSFGDEQVRQIAIALENSGCRFLWSLRSPPQKGAAGFLPGNYDNLEDVLPEGFLERTAEVGKVIGWAPQGAVLAHRATGGFVTHCGWNSVLESVWCGVPTAAWPQYAEQQTNAFFLVKEAEVAVEIKMDYVKGVGADASELVCADVIESGIRKLTENGEHNEVRKKVKEMQEMSRMAGHGSSSLSLKRFLDNVVDNIA